MVKRYSNLWIYSSLALVLLFFCRCKPETDPQTKELKEYLQSAYKVSPGKTTERIYIINDLGCGNCILSLSEFVKKQVNDDNALIIINSRGMNVDLNAFEEKKKKNPHIIIRHQAINDKNDMFYHSGVVYMKEEKVDTIVNLIGEDLAGPLQYIFTREKNKRK